MFGSLDNKPFQHISRNGTDFSSASCDLRGGVKVVKPVEITEAKLAADFVEFGAFHAMEIRERVSSFPGYDCIDYTIVIDPESEA